MSDISGEESTQSLIKLRSCSPIEYNGNDNIEGFEVSAEATKFKSEANFRCDQVRVTKMGQNLNNTNDVDWRSGGLSQFSDSCLSFEHSSSDNLMRRIDFQYNKLSQASYNKQCTDEAKEQYFNIGESFEG